MWYPCLCLCYRTATGRRKGKEVERRESQNHCDRLAGKTRRCVARRRLPFPPFLPWGSSCTSRRCVCPCAPRDSARRSSSPPTSLSSLSVTNALPARAQPPSLPLVFVPAARLLAGPASQGKLETFPAGNIARFSNDVVVLRDHSRVRECEGRKTRLALGRCLARF